MKRSTLETLFVVLILSLVFAGLSVWDFNSLEFRPITESNIAAIISTMFVVSVFMERSVEAILVPIRKPHKQTIEHEIIEIEEEIANGTAQKSDLLSKKKELDRYRLGTAKRAYWISFTFGILISFVGVRVLSGLIELSELNQLDGFQKQIFEFVDVLITGGVIAGGSAAIDKLGRKISDTLSLKSVTNS